MEGSAQINEEVLQEVYAWIDRIPLSRPKRNIARDFSDGVMAAEVVKHFFPKLVDLHNYTAAHCTHQKLCNWSTLNRKVFSKLNFNVPADTVKKIVVSTAGFIEPVLCSLRERIEERRAEKLFHAEGTQDLEYYSITNGKPKSEDHQIIDITHTNRATVKMAPKVRAAANFGPNVDPAFLLLLDEKDQAILALQEAVEILQIKVNKLEHLLHLKDLRIEDLTKHFEGYKACNNVT